MTNGELMTSCMDRDADRADKAFRSLDAEGETSEASGEQETGGTRGMDDSMDSMVYNRGLETGFGDRDADRAGGIWRMSARYNLEEGKMDCRCLLRKWKFCTHIKGLADNRVSKSLVMSRALEEARKTYEINNKQWALQTKDNSGLTETVAGPENLQTNSFTRTGGIARKCFPQIYKNQNNQMFLD